MLLLFRFCQNIRVRQVFVSFISNSYHVVHIRQGCFWKVVGEGPMSGNTASASRAVVQGTVASCHLNCISALLGPSSTTWYRRDSQEISRWRTGVTRCGVFVSSLVRDVLKGRHPPVTLAGSLKMEDRAIISLAVLEQNSHVLLFPPWAAE